jgi:hypothetical protein
MKINVLYDSQGKILSAGVPSPQSYDFRGPRSGPKASEGQYAAELDVPEEHAQMNFAELGDRLRVDVKSKQHKLISKSE